MSERVSLMQSTGSERFDAALRDLIARYDELFPGCMRTCFMYERQRRRRHYGRDE